MHAFARAAARAFPSYAAALESAAAAFDDVRYLRRPGTEELYRRIAAVDDSVTAARPVLPELTEARRVTAVGDCAATTPTASAAGVA